MYHVTFVLQNLYFLKFAKLLMLMRLLAITFNLVIIADVSSVTDVHMLL